MAKSNVLGSLVFSLAISTACGDPESKSKRTEVNSADAIDDKEDIVAERPAVISGSHLFCSEEPGVMGEDHIDVVCSIIEDIDFEKYVDKDYLVIEVAGKVVPITIDDNGKFKFSLPKGQDFSTSSIEVLDTEKEKSDYDPEVLANSDDLMDDESESQISESSESGDDGESETEQEIEEDNDEEDNDEEDQDDMDDEEDDKDKNKDKGKDKKSIDDSEEEDD